MLMTINVENEVKQKELYTAAVQKDENTGPL